MSHNIYPLGYRNYTISVSEFRDTAIVHIRTRDGTKGFTKDGLALLPAEYYRLMDIHKAVSDLIPTVRDSPGLTRHWTIGDRGRRVTLKNFRGQAFIDLRNYWAPPGHTLPLPTTIGAVLTPAAWGFLATMDIFVRDDIKTLERAILNRNRWENEVHAGLETRRRLLEEAAVAASPVDPTVQQEPQEPLPDLPPAGEIAAILPVDSIPCPGPSGANDPLFTQQSAQEIPLLASYYLNDGVDDADDDDEQEDDKENDIRIVKVDIPQPQPPSSGGKRQSTKKTAAAAAKKSRRI